MRKPIIVLLIGDVDAGLAGVVAAAIARHTNTEVSVINADETVGKITYADIRSFCLETISDRRKAFDQAARAWVQLLSILPGQAILCVQCKQYCGTCRCEAGGYAHGKGWRYLWDCENWVVVPEAVRALLPDAFDSLHRTTAGNLRAFVASLNA